MSRNRYWLPALLVASGLGALGTTAAFAAPAEQHVTPIVDQPADIEFEDPCTGLDVHGVAIENGIERFTDLGDQGHHARVRVSGVVDLYDGEDEFVGTWTYRLHFLDQYPPDAQGAVHLIAIGRLQYASGDTAVVRVLLEHQVFGKGDVLKREFSNATCG